MTNTTTTTMITITKKQIKDFAIQYLGLEHDEEKNEFYSIRGEYAKPIELVGTRMVTSEEEILKSMDSCSRNY